MRATILLLAGCAALSAGQVRQQSTRTYTYDGDGNRYEAAKTGSVQVSPGFERRTERTTSLNGRQVPVESVTERVLEDGPRGRVVERVIQRYDASGEPVESEKVHIETRTDSAGRETTRTTRSRTDLSGRYQVYERSTAQTSKRGTTAQTTTTVERPSLNGNMSVVQRREERLTENEAGSTTNVTIYNAEPGGSLRQAARETVEVVDRDDRQTTTTTRYDAVNATGTMAFSSQTIEESELQQDGSQTRVISEYGAAAPGRSITGSLRPQLREQRIVERSVQRDGTVVETTGVRRVTLSDPGQLGDYQKVSETVCTGACLSEASAAEGGKGSEGSTDDTDS